MDHPKKQREASKFSLRESIKVPYSTLNSPNTKFYNSDDVNVIAAELRLTKTRPTSFYEKYNLL